MDTLRGNLSGYGLPEEDGTNYDRGEDDNYRELPPAAIGQDERRMQVRAYNFWASLLTDRNLPSIEDLDPENLPDFGPNSVLLDFSLGIEDPAIVFLGNKLAAECGSSGPIAKLSDVPSRSLLSRITDHHLQIIANQAPIGFEAEFVNHSGVPIMYRGILLPFSSDDDTIDFIFGVINWKEIADQETTDSLLQEIDQALQASPEPAQIDGSLTAWTDGLANTATVPQDEDDPEADANEDGWPAVLPVADEADIQAETELDVPSPMFGQRRRGLIASVTADDWSNVPAAQDSEEIQPVASLAPVPEIYQGPSEETQPEAVREFDDFDHAEFGITPVPAGFDDPAENEARPVDAADAPDDSDTLDLSAFAELDSSIEGDFDHAAEVPFADAAPAAIFADEAEMELADWLASARELAHAAQDSEHRSRQSLYAAIGRAYDFSIAAAANPEGFAELVADAGLTCQDRAPMTPLVKLVFGANYDKTRLTEYAAVLSHAARLDIECGALENWLLQAPGGLKAVVQAERKLRREESGLPQAEVRSPRERLARKLRKLETRPLSAVEADGSEFTLLVARRLEDGTVVLLGEVGDDAMLLERAARRLIA